MRLIVLALLFIFPSTIRAIIRTNYIQIQEEIWDYAPHGNLIYTGDPKDAEFYLNTDKNIPLPGTKFKKAIYRGYTDDTFSERTKDPPWQGMIGPFLIGEVGDTIVVHFKNNASRVYGIHPHGVFYHKNNEGAMYNDSTSGKDLLDTEIRPGENYTYVWVVHPDYGPTEDDPDCISWLYHSHGLAEIEIMSGAVGILATCKPFTLNEKGNLFGVTNIALLFSTIDENFSFYRAENTIAAGINPATVSENLPIWQLANKKHSINGFIYGNLPGLEVCEGDKINLYIAVIGNDYDLHTVYVQGQTMEVFQQKTTTVGLYAGSSLTATIESANEGKWLLSCQSRNAIKAGMQAFFTVKKCKNSRPNSNDEKKYSYPMGKIRNYYITAEEVIWNYAPSGVDKITGRKLTLLAPQSFGKSSEHNCRLNGTYKKAVYKEYSDKTFKEPILRKGNDRHLGFLGPVIAAEVGDTVNVLFWNRASRPYSIQINRFYGIVNQQGTKYKGSPKVEVKPNEKRSYSWTVRQSVAPSSYDPDCVTGRYYSAVDQVKDTFSGLNGFILVCKKGHLYTNFAKIYDRLFYLSFSNVMETESHYFKENVARACGSHTDADLLSQNDTFVEANTMISINGYSYANLPGLNMKEGETVAWFLTSTGNYEDIHTPFFHGNTFKVDGMNRDVCPLIADLYKTLIMEPDNPGTWLIEDDIYKGTNELGMKALYKVMRNKNKRKRKPQNSKVRTYFIGAVEEIWDYAPGVDINPITGVPLVEDPALKLFYEHGDNRIGYKYIKALYREFSDDTFEHQKERFDDTKHLGTLGPFIKAEVNDTIRVVFKNLARFNFSIQPHGVFYNESNEGQFYERGDHGSRSPGDSVAPGKVHVYEWFVPPRAGPTEEDFNCVVWIYKSTVNEYADGSAGLYGPIVICNPGILNGTGHRKDVNREFALFFNIYIEQDSPYIVENIKKFTGKPNETLELLSQNEEQFFESTVKMAINGYTFDSIPPVRMLLGETAAFYLFGWGSSYSTHTVHFHGNTFRRRNTGYHRHDVMDVLPSVSTQVEIIGVNPGRWLLHCHINNHSQKGMLMTYQVIDPDELYHPN